MSLCMPVAMFVAILLAFLLEIEVGSKISGHLAVEPQFNRRTNHCHAIARLYHPGGTRAIPLVDTGRTVGRQATW